ncbi:MAG TPA: hypothetical protein VFF91_00530 [Pseudoxanthomonas sp.]|nr:hypothetical protein [Pseudoxanthomonas sp.]
MKIPFRPTAACLLLALAACRAEPPPTEQPPEPQAQSNTELRDAIQAPQQKAQAVEQTLQDGADRQRARIEAAEAGG